MNRFLAILLLLIFAGSILEQIEEIFTFEREKNYIIEKYPNSVVRYKQIYTTKAFMGYFKRTQSLDFEKFYWENGKERITISYNFDEVSSISYYNRDGWGILFCIYIDGNISQKEIVDHKGQSQVQIIYDDDNLYGGGILSVYFSGVNHNVDFHISDDGTHFWSLNGNKKYSKSDMYHMLEPYYIIENRLNSNIQELEVNSNYHIL